MRYIVVITLLLAAMLAGCDDAPAAPTSANSVDWISIPLPDGGQLIEMVFPSGKPPHQPSAGRGKYTGRCFPVKNNNALATLGGSIGPDTKVIGGPADNRTMYRIWTFLGDGKDAEPYHTVFVVETSESFIAMEKAGRRVCIGDLVRPGRDSVTWRATGWYWGALR